MFRSRYGRQDREDRWPWSPVYVTRGMGGRLQEERVRVKPLSVINRELESELRVQTGYLNKEREDNAFLRGNLQNLERMYANVQQERNRLLAEIQNLQREVYDSDNAYRNARDEISKLKRNNKKLRREIKDYQDRRDVDSTIQNYLWRKWQESEARLRQEEENVVQLDDWIQDRNRQILYAHQNIERLAEVIKEKKDRIEDLREMLRRRM